MHKLPTIALLTLILLASIVAIPNAQSRSLSSTISLTTVNPARQSGWTAAATEKRRPDIAPVTLHAIRTGRHKGFDRVVFEFRGGAMPGYHVEYVDKPVRSCGSGDVLRVAGSGWLSVRLTPAQAHTDAGVATLKYRERRLRFPVLKELQSTCDFEGEVQWVLGVASANHYRVMELSDPARLVIDIKH
jgi:hypothetical protein